MHLGSLLVLLLAIDPRAKTVDVSGGAVAELRGGRAPVVIDADPEPSMLMVVIPNVDFRLRMRRRGLLMFGYAPRFVLRVPNILGVRRPLVLHQLSLLYDVSLSRRWDFSGAVTSSVGELDYTANNLVLGTMQGTTPAAAVLQYAVVEANQTFTARASSVDTFIFGPAFAYRTPIGEDAQLVDDPTPEQIAMIMPEQLSGSLVAAYTRSVSPRDDVSAQVTPGIMSFSPGALFSTVDARLAWGRQLRPRLRSRLDGGVFMVHVLDRRDDPFGARNRVLPVANAGLTGRLLSRARVRLEGDVTAGINGFFDVLRGTVQPRVGGSAQLAAEMPPRWRAGVLVSFFTSANSSPQTVVDGTQPLLDETVLFAQTPVTYMIDERMFFEFGTIVTARGPHLSVEEFSFANQLEVWGYVAFRFSIGTSRGGREVEGRTGSIGGLGPAAGVTGAAIGSQRGPQPGAPPARGAAGPAAPLAEPPAGTPTTTTPPPAGTPYGRDSSEEDPRSTREPPPDIEPLVDEATEEEEEDDETDDTGVLRAPVEAVDRRAEPVVDDGGSDGQ